MQTVRQDLPCPINRSLRHLAQFPMANAFVRRWIIVAYCNARTLSPIDEDAINLTGNPGNLSLFHGFTAVVRGVHRPRAAAGQEYRGFLP
jgi:hypothetical protein